MIDRYSSSFFFSLQGIIYLVLIKEVELHDRTITLVPQNSGERVWVLRADSAEEAQDWVNAIRQVMDKLNASYVMAVDRTHTQVEFKSVCEPKCPPSNSDPKTDINNQSAMIVGLVSSATSPATPSTPSTPSAESSSALSAKPAATLSTTPSSTLVPESPRELTFNATPLRVSMSRNDVADWFVVRGEDGFSRMCQEYGIDGKGALYLRDLAIEDKRGFLEFCMKLGASPALALRIGFVLSSSHS
jgi:hypothetical protein